MHFTLALLSLLPVIGFVAAQTLDPSVVPEFTREHWCEVQRESCPLICRQLPGTTDIPKKNDCDAETLVFHCICSNNMTPNATEYSQTIPYFICTEVNKLCVENCKGDSSCQSACQEDNPCGAQHPKPVNKTSSATAISTAASSTAADAVYTGLGEGSAAATKPKSGDAIGNMIAGLGHGSTLGLVSVLLFGFAVLI